MHFFYECTDTDLARVRATKNATVALETLGGSDLAQWKAWSLPTQNQHVLSQAHRLSDKAERLVRSAAADVWVTHTKRISDQWIANPGV